MTKRIAAVTMVFNDPEYLPIWCKYYGDVFGPDHCYIIDHGSTDGSTLFVKDFNVIRIPRSPKDNEKRTRFVSNFCASLLEWYDGFLHTDIDEIVVNGGSRADSLRSMIDSLPLGVFSTIGFDVQHATETEAALDLSKPVTEQRRWIRFSSSMCKPVLSFRPITWSPGFHSANAALVFADLYLFHLRFFDLTLALSRLRRTRAMQWARPDAGSHQRVDDKEFVAMVERVGRLPKLEGVELSQEKEPLLGYLQKVRQSEKDFRTHTYPFDLHIFGAELMELPAQFRGLF